MVAKLVDARPAEQDLGGKRPPATQLAWWLQHRLAIAKRQAGTGELAAVAMATCDYRNRERKAADLCFQETSPLVVGLASSVG